jgi:hypothetical protein
LALALRIPSFVGYNKDRGEAVAAICALQRVALNGGAMP